MLAKKKRGTKAMLDSKRTALSTTKARSLKMRILMSGWATRVSKTTKPASTARPAAMHSQVAGLSHPQVPACSKPNTDNPMPSATRTAPR